MKILIIIILLIGCAGTPTLPPLTEIHHVQGVIYCQHSELNSDTRHYYIRSEAVVGMPGQMLQQSVYTIPGISSVYPSPYKLTVAICPIYSWDEIEPEIYKRINEFLTAYESSKSVEPQQDRSQGM